MYRQRDDKQGIRIRVWARQTVVREAALLGVLAFVGWWAANGNCDGENHLHPAVGLVAGSSLMLPRLAVSSGWPRDGAWPARLTLKIIGLAYVWMVLGFLFAPVTGRCNEDGWLLELAGTAVLWGMFMAIILEVLPSRRADGEGDHLVDR